MVLVDDLSRSIVLFEQQTTLVGVIEMGANSWPVAASVPGIERQPLKKLEPDAPTLLRSVERWRAEAVKAGRTIARIVVAFEAGRDGFWLARWLITRGIEAHVIPSVKRTDRWYSTFFLARGRPANPARAYHRSRNMTAGIIHSASVAVSRERKRAKTDRLDAAMLMRVVLGWLRGERGHCGMVAIPDARGRRRAATEPRAGEPGWRAFANDQPDEGCACAAWHSWLQGALAEGAATSGGVAHAGRHGTAPEYPGRVPARHDAAGIGAGAD